MIKLDSVVQIRKGTTTPARYAEETFELYSIPGFDIGKPEVLSGANIKSNKTNVFPGDVLFSKLNPRIPRVWIVPPKTEFRQISSTEFWPLVMDQSVLDPYYLRYYLQTPRVRERLSPSTEAATKSRSRIKPFQLLGESIPLPPISDQRRIVDILDQAERLRGLRAEADAKAARILPALFIKMFGDPATNPMGWRVKRIGEVCNVVSGATPKTNQPEFWGGGVPWATPKDLSDLEGWSIAKTGRTLTEKGLASCSATMIPKESLLLSSRAPIGLVALAGVPMCTNQGFKNLVCGSEVDPWYLFGWCKLRSNFLQSLGQGATFKEISKRIVESIRLPVPSMETQQHFRANLMKLMANDKNRIQSSQRIADLFEVLLTRAFTGDLTASWCEAHEEQLLQEMEQQRKCHGDVSS
ncbi:MAG: restriction endonuclease subunit S [Gemmatimonadota bacterium]|nr:restriction endonuclease subunit S [Gemmatimonadota bacterium]